MQIRLLHEPQIDPATDSAIRRILMVCFPHNQTLFATSRYWRGHIPLYTVAGLDGESIMACTVVLDRTIRVGDKNVRVAGVGNVCVLPEYRGRGLVDQILIATMDEAKRKGFRFGLLFCRPEIMKVYEHTGWQPYMDRRFLRIDHETGQIVEIPSDHGKMVRLLTDHAFPSGDIDLRCDKW